MKWIFSFIRGLRLDAKRARRLVILEAQEEVLWDAIKDRQASLHLANAEIMGFRGLVRNLRAERDDLRRLVEELQHRLRWSRDREVQLVEALAAEIKEGLPCECHSIPMTK